MTVRVADITSADWSPKVGSPGDVVVEMEDIDQCVGIILTTRKGSDPHRPLFGCDAWRYIDAPVNSAIPNIIREAVDALEEWEPRITLVRVTAAIDGSRVALTVTWTVTLDDQTYTSEATL